jgi:hypothetical protein
MRWVLYALITAGWLAAEFSLGAITEDGNIQAVWGLAFAAMYGLLIGRWLALGAPVIAAVGIVVYSLVKPCTDCDEELPFLFIVVLMVFYVLLAEVAIAIGVGIRQFLRVRRSDDSPHVPPLG